MMVQLSTATLALLLERYPLREDIRKREAELSDLVPIVAQARVPAAVDALAAELATVRQDLEALAAIAAETDPSGPGPGGRDHRQIDWTVDLVTAPPRAEVDAAYAERSGGVAEPLALRGRLLAVQRVVTLADLERWNPEQRKQIAAWLDRLEAYFAADDDAFADAPPEPAFFRESDLPEGWRWESGRKWGEHNDVLVDAEGRRRHHLDGDVVAGLAEVDAAAFVPVEITPGMQVRAPGWQGEEFWYQIDQVVSEEGGGLRLKVSSEYDRRREFDANRWFVGVWFDGSGWVASRGERLAFLPAPLTEPDDRAAAGREIQETLRELPADAWRKAVEASAGMTAVAEDRRQERARAAGLCEGCGGIPGAPAGASSACTCRTTAPQRSVAEQAIGLSRAILSAPPATDVVRPGEDPTWTAEQRAAFRRGDYSRRGGEDHVALYCDACACDQRGPRGRDQCQHCGRSGQLRQIPEELADCAGCGSHLSECTCSAAEAVGPNPTPADDPRRAHFLGVIRSLEGSIRITEARCANRARYLETGVDEYGRELTRSMACTYRETDTIERARMEAELVQLRRLRESIGLADPPPAAEPSTPDLTDRDRALLQVLQEAAAQSPEFLAAKEEASPYVLRLALAAVRDQRRSTRRVGKIEARLRKLGEPIEPPATAEAEEEEPPAPQLPVEPGEELAPIDDRHAPEPYWVAIRLAGDRGQVESTDGQVRVPMPRADLAEEYAEAWNAEGLRMPPRLPSAVSPLGAIRPRAKGHRATKVPADRLVTYPALLELRLLHLREAMEALLGAIHLDAGVEAGDLVDACRRVAERRYRSLGRWLPDHAIRLHGPTLEEVESIGRSLSLPPIGELVEEHLARPTPEPPRHEDLAAAAAPEPAESPQVWRRIVEDRNPGNLPDLLERVTLEGARAALRELLAQPKGMKARIRIEAVALRVIELETAPEVRTAFSVARAAKPRGTWIILHRQPGGKAGQVAQLHRRETAAVLCAAWNAGCWDPREWPGLPFAAPDNLFQQTASGAPAADSSTPAPEPEHQVEVPPADVVPLVPPDTHLRRTGGNAWAEFTRPGETWLGIEVGSVLYSSCGQVYRVKRLYTREADRWDVVSITGVSLLDAREGRKGSEGQINELRREGGRWFTGYAEYWFEPAGVLEAARAGGGEPTCTPEEALRAIAGEEGQRWWNWHGQHRATLAELALGASDARLADDLEVGRLLGCSISCYRPGLRFHAVFNHWRGPSVWCFAPGDHWTHEYHNGRVPDLHGEAVLHLVREVLGIPYPEAGAAPLAAGAVEQTVNMWLQEHVDGVGRKTAQGLHGCFASVEELVGADAEQLTQALLRSGVFSMEGAARKKAGKYHEAIQAAAAAKGLLPGADQMRVWARRFDEKVTDEALAELLALPDWDAYRDWTRRHHHHRRLADWVALRPLLEAETSGADAPAQADPVWRAEEVDGRAYVVSADGGVRYPVDVEMGEPLAVAEMLAEEWTNLGATEPVPPCKSCGAVRNLVNDWCRVCHPDPFAHPVPEGEARCVICGCTDSQACPEGCTWEVVDYQAGEGVCSTPACVATGIDRGLVHPVHAAADPLAELASWVAEYLPGRELTPQSRYDLVVEGSRGWKDFQAVCSRYGWPATHEAHDALHDLVVRHGYVPLGGSEAGRREAVPEPATQSAAEPVLVMEAEGSAAPALPPREGDVSEQGPHRFFIRRAPDDLELYELVDRSDGQVLTTARWQSAWGQALRINGLVPDPEGLLERYGLTAAGGEERGDTAAGGGSLPPDVEAALAGLETLLVIRGGVARAEAVGTELQAWAGEYLGRPLDEAEAMALAALAGTWEGYRRVTERMGVPARPKAFDALQGVFERRGEAVVRAGEAPALVSALEEIVAAPAERPIEQLGEEEARCSPGERRALVAAATDEVAEIHVTRKLQEYFLRGVRAYADGGPFPAGGYAELQEGFRWAAAWCRRDREVRAAIAAELRAAPPTPAASDPSPEPEHPAHGAQEEPSILTAEYATQVMGEMETRCESVQEVHQVLQLVRAALLRDAQGRGDPGAAAYWAIEGPKLTNTDLDRVLADRLIGEEGSALEGRREGVGSYRTPPGVRGCLTVLPSCTKKTKHLRGPTLVLWVRAALGIGWSGAASPAHVRAEAAA